MAEPLGDLLRSLRTGALLSQEALAERSGLSARTVSDIETGAARTPRLVTVMLLAEALGLSEADRARLRDAARKPAARTEVEAPAAAAPLRPVPLVGRDADALHLRTLLERDDVRLLTLVGPAGVGKTSLAVQVAAQSAGAFELGATLVELAAIADPSLVPRATARALNIRESGEMPASDAVAAHLRERTALLLLDNLEHLTPAAAWIGDLLTQAPKLKFLLTSREPLRLRAERVYPVKPLESQAAIALFVQRAQMVSPDFGVTDANSRAIETIVDHLEGLPLAIELAAPRLQLLPPKALAARLERRLPLLGDGAADRPARQQTMHGAIAWSYDLLSPDEQIVFRRLAVLRGGGTLDAAAAAVGPVDGERSILMRLAPLVEKNMLALVEDASGEPRVAMLEMLREYAQERLSEAGELEDAQLRHAQYVLEFAQNAARELSGARQRQGLARFELEHANVAAALDWAARARATALGFALLAAAWRYWWLHGGVMEGLEWIGRFLAMRAAGAPEVSDALYAVVLRAKVVLLSALGNFDEAHVACEEAIALQRALHDDSGLAGSLTSLGIIFQFRGDNERAQAAHEEALALRRRLHDEVGVATSLSNLASIAFSDNDPRRTTELGEESVAIYRRLGHESGLAHALTKLGLAAAAEGDYARAEDIFGECLRMQRAVGNVGSMHYSLINLGAAAHKRGDHELALARFHEALDLLQTTPNKASLAKVLEDMGFTLAALGDEHRGVRLLGAADAVRRTIRTPVFASERAEYEAEIARLRAKLGETAFDAAWRIGASVTLERALEEARETRRVPAAADRNRH